MTWLQLAALAVGGVVVVLGGLAAAFLAGACYQQHASARLARVQVAPLRGFVR